MLTPVCSLILSTIYLSIIHNRSGVKCAKTGDLVSLFSACNIPVHSLQTHSVIESGGAPPMQRRCQDLGHMEHRASIASLWQRQQYRSLLPSSSKISKNGFSSNFYVYSENSWQKRYHFLPLETCELTQLR